MHGVIFASFRDYLLTEHGGEIAQEVTVGEPQYTLSEAYPDEQFLALLERAVARTGLPRDELLFEFGVFTAATTFRTALRRPLQALRDGTRLPADGRDADPRCRSLDDARGAAA